MHDTNMNFSWKQLQMFVVVAKSTSLSQAAEVLHIGQPGLTRAIKDLEEQLGIELFVRSSTRRLQLSEQGLVFLPIVERFLLTMSGTLQALRILANEGVEKLRIGMSFAFSSALLADVLRSYAELVPSVQLGLFEGNSAEICRKVLQGELDIGIGQPVAESAALASFELLRAPMGVLIDSKRHPGCGLKLANFVAERPEFTRANYNNGFRVLRFKVVNGEPVVINNSVVSSLGLQIELVRSGLGASINSALGASNAAALEFDFFTIKPEVVRSTHCFYQQSISQNIATARVIEVLKHVALLEIPTLRPEVQWVVNKKLGADPTLLTD